MSLILPTRCGCAFKSSSLEISGRGTADAPYQFNQPGGAFVGRFFNFASAAERTSMVGVTPPTESDICYLRDTDRYEAYTGAAWVRINAWTTTTGRTGVILRRVANQSFTSGVLAAISWDTEDFDSDGFIAVTATTITIPAGLGGIWTILARVAFAVNARAQIATPSFTFDDSASGDALTPSPSVTCRLAAGDTVIVSAQQSSGGAQNATALLEMYRVGP
jgi:hypothetical protein